MKITVIGRGNVGGGLAEMWQRAGHQVDALGSDGGDASASDVVVVAVPGNAIDDALGRITGIEGKPVIDTTNAARGRAGDFPSLAHQVKSHTKGPVAKAFNLNFAALYDQISDQRLPPSNFFCGDEEVRPFAEQLSRDAGYEPVYAGGLENARAMEDFLAVVISALRGGLGPFFIRVAKPGER